MGSLDEIERFEGAGCRDDLLVDWREVLAGDGPSRGVEDIARAGDGLVQHNGGSELARVVADIAAEDDEGGRRDAREGAGVAFDVLHEEYMVSEAYFRHDRKDRLTPGQSST